VKFVLEKFFDVMKAMLTWNPTVYPLAGANTIIRNMAPTILSIVQPFYVMAAILTGIYYIFAAIDPKRRAAAKNMLLKLLVGMVIVGLSLPIYQFILELSRALTIAVFSEAYAQFAGQPGGSIAVIAVVIVISIIVFPQLLIIAILVVLYIMIIVLIVMAIRYVLVVIFAILFPITLFLYFFDFTKTLIPCILSIILINLFNMGYTDCWTTLLLYPFGMVPFTYVLSFLFKEEGAASSFMLFSNVVAGSILPIAILILRMIPATAVDGDIY